MAYLANGVFVSRYQPSHGGNVNTHNPVPQHNNYDLAAGRQHHETRKTEMNDIRGKLANVQDNSSDYLKLLNRYHELENEERTQQTTIQTAIKEGPAPTSDITKDATEKQKYTSDLIKLEQDISKTLNGDDDGKADGLIDIGKGRYLPKNDVATSIPGSSTIPIGTLKLDQPYLSPNGKFMLKMQADGNLVEYVKDDAAGWKAVWASNTMGKGAKADMQQDGNLVVYDKDGQAVWASQTGGHAGAQLSLRDDGNLVIYDKGQAIWDRQHYSDPVASMSVATKFEEALKAAGEQMPEETFEKFKELLSPESLAIIAASLAVWAASHAVGVGEVVDILLLGAGVIFLGFEAIDAGKDIIDFIKGAATAETEADIKKAGEHLAEAVATIGIDTVLVLLTHKAGGFKDKPPTTGAGSITVSTVRFPRIQNVDPKTLQRNPGDEFHPPQGWDSSKYNFSAEAFARERATLASTGKISKPILVKQLLDGSLQIIDGHHRWWVAMHEFNKGTVPIKIIEIEKRG